MPATLDLQAEYLTYTGNFARPAFDLWGAGGVVISQLYDALAPYNVKLQNVQLASAIASAADTIFTVRIGRTTILKLSLDKIEVSFAEFSDEDFRAIPKLLHAATGWLRKVMPQFHFGSHQVLYASHSFLKETETGVDDFLRAINSRAIRSAGLDIGGGAIFRYSVPGKKWLTQLTFDKSQHISGALFIGLSVNIDDEIESYESLLFEGRAYFENALNELGLTLPELQ